MRGDCPAARTSVQSALPCVQQWGCWAGVKAGSDGPLSHACFADHGHGFMPSYVYRQLTEFYHRQVSSRKLRAACLPSRMRAARAVRSCRPSPTRLAPCLVCTAGFHTGRCSTQPANRLSPCAAPRHHAH